MIRSLERRSEIGRTGEAIALEDEVRRLRSDGKCPEPEKYLKHIALDDVGRGYDIESFWPGHERFIEVKASTGNAKTFFISENEKRVLGELGPRGWIYFVEVGADGTGTVANWVQDPIHSIPEQNFVPVSWRVKLG